MVCGQMGHKSFKCLSFQKFKVLDREVSSVDLPTHEYVILLYMFSEKIWKIDGNFILRQ